MDKIKKQKLAGVMSFANKVKSSKSLIISEVAVMTCMPKIAAEMPQSTVNKVGSPEAYLST